MTRNLPFDSDVRQWSHPLMIPLHCLWTNSNNRTPSQFECTWLAFVFVLTLFAHDGIILREWGSFEIGRPRSRGWKNFELRWTGGEKSWRLNNFQRCHMCPLLFNKFYFSLQDTCATFLLFLYVEIMRSRGCPVKPLYTNWKVIEWR